MTGFIYRLTPALLALALGFMTLFIAETFLLGLGQEGQDLLRLSHVFKIVLPMVLLLIGLRTYLSHDRFKELAFGAGLGGLALISWTLFEEYTRLAPYVQGGRTWGMVLRYVDLYAIVAAAGGLVLTIWFFSMAWTGSGRNRAGRKKAKRSKNATYGDADWMPMSDAAELFPDGPGIVIGERYRPDEDTAAGPIFDPGEKATWGQGGKAPKLAFNCDFGSTHGIVFAGSGGFKTTGIVIPTCLNWDTGLVVLDPSREVGPMVAAERERMGQDVYVLDPERPELGFNVLDWIKDSDAPEENVAATANWLLAEKPKVSTGSDDFFRTSGLQLITGILADILLSGNTPEHLQTLRHLRSVLASPEPNLKERLSDIYEQSPNAFVRETVAPYINMTDSTFSGVYATASKETQWLSFERYGQLVSGNHFKTEDLKNGATDVFINLDLKTLRTHPGMGRVIVGALMNAIYEADGDTDGRVLFLIDEADTLGHMEIVKTARDAGRKYGITLLLIYQSIGQLIDNWGQNAKSSWYESTSFRLFAAINDEKTAEELSRMCGEFTVETTTRSRSSGMQQKNKIFGSPNSNRTVNKQDQKRRLILPHEILQEMRSDEQLVFVQGRPPLRTGRAIYFRRGDMVDRVDQNRFNKSGED